MIFSLAYKSEEVPLSITMGMTKERSPFVVLNLRCFVAFERKREVGRDTTAWLDGTRPVSMLLLVTFFQAF